jgi:hypothetical protein
VKIEEDEVYLQFNDEEFVHFAAFALGGQRAD